MAYDIGAFQSTHPVGGGTGGKCHVTIAGVFQSTHPVGGGTLKTTKNQIGKYISIHPPRGGWDGVKSLCEQILHHISIHPPRGGWDWFSATLFISFSISIHPPRGAMS